MAGITDMAPYRITRSGLDLIKRLEGFRDRPVRLDNGRWMIGYGHVFSARPRLALSRKEAELLLLYDLSAIGEAFESLIFTPLSQNQTDALFSLVYNIGLEAFAGSEVLCLINQGAMVPAAAAMEQWCQADLRGHSMVIDGLVRRRAAEKALFLTPRGGWQPAPSHILVPLAQVQAALPLGLDMDAPIASLGSPFEPQNGRGINEGAAPNSDGSIQPDVMWPAPLEREARPRFSESPLIMIGIAIASLGVIGAGAFQGLAEPSQINQDIGLTILAWAFSLIGLMAIALLVRNLIKKIVNNT